MLLHLSKETARDADDSQEAYSYIMSYPEDGDVHIDSSSPSQSAQRPADQLYVENEDVDLTSDYLSDAPSDRSLSSQQSVQKTSSAGDDAPAGQSVAEDEHQDHSDEDPQDFASVPSRPNRFRGPPSTWRNWTAPERDLAASLDQLQAKDLSVHLYNSFQLRHRNHTQDSSQRAQSSKNPSEAGKVSQWIPPKVWTAWPLPPGIVPREHDERLWEEDAVPSELYPVKSNRPGQHLQELLFAQVLRKAKDRFRDRTWGDAQQAAHPAIRSPRQSQGQQRRSNERSRTKEDNEALAKKPVFMADDQRASEILQPTVRHMLTRLDDLLMGLHHGRNAYVSAEDSGSESQSQTSQRSASRGRRQKRKSEASNPDVDAQASKDAPNDTGSDSDKHRLTRKKSGSKGKTQHAGSASHRSRSKNFRDRKGRLGLRGWSDVLGIASMTGWHQPVVASAASRCANIFGEGIKFRTLEEGKKTHEEHLYLPGASLPISNVKSQDNTWGAVVSSRSKFESKKVGGVHVDGFLKPIEGKKSWLYSNKNKSKRRQRSDGIKLKHRGQAG